MKYWVYYHDGGYEDGCIGLVKYDTKSDVIKFIEKRMAMADNPSLRDYTVIEGYGIEIEEVERITKVQFKNKS